MRIGICDDMATDRRVLRSMLNDYYSALGTEVQVDMFVDADSLFNAFSPGKYDILFLDIYMPNMTGMDAAKKIRATDGVCKLVFATTSEDHALDSYGVYAAGYLLKPFTRAQFNETLDWCMDSMPTPPASIEIITERRRISVNPDDIVYIEVYGREVLFHTTDGVYSANRTLGSIEQELPDGFLRCHRSYVINMNHVQKLDKAAFIMPAGESVPISVDALVRIKQEFFDWVFSHMRNGR